MSDSAEFNPRPAAVRYNDWGAVALPPWDSFQPQFGVTVVVSYFEAPEALGRTLAGLERQTYPRGLFDVVVVDDGSRPALSLPRTTLDVTVVHQEDRGFGLARARNNGAHAATHDILVFLDGDMIADSDLVMAHAIWHHVVEDALTLGFRLGANVDELDAEAIRQAGTLDELLSGVPFDVSRERKLERTSEMTSRHDDLFRLMVGANFGIRRQFYESLGGSDESFDRYGGEDTELAYRAYTRGALLVPVRRSFGWHQGLPGEDGDGKAEALRAQAAKLAHLVAHPGFRPTVPGRTYAVPQFVVTVVAGHERVADIVEAVEAVLADPLGDLVVRIDTRDCGTEVRAALADHFGPDARVRLSAQHSPLDEFASSPFHVVVPGRPVFEPGVVGQLRTALGDRVTATAEIGGGETASITKAWALHRARRTGMDAVRFGDGTWCRVRKRGPLRDRGARGGHYSAVSKVLAEARHVRGWRTGLAFTAWLAVGIRNRWSRRRAADRAVTEPGRALGAEIVAIGPRARAVFGASPHVVQRPKQSDHVDLVVADTASAAVGIEVPLVDLSKANWLSVPAVDPGRHNPIGWRRVVECSVGALGPRALLPPGVRADMQVAPTDQAALRRVHHVLDVAAFHSNVVDRAGMLARLAATGLPVVLADRAPVLEDLLGVELYGLMRGNIGNGADAREAASIRMRRAALRAHSFRSRCLQMCRGLIEDPPQWPAVSILLATGRPSLLPWAIANVARQNYPRLELVLALHGEGFHEAESALLGLGMPVKTLRIGERRPLGAVLNAAAAVADGVLLTKMDDDDVYGADHIWDLVLAREYSGADLVGKSMRTVYLRGRDCTLQRAGVRAETFSPTVAGGTILIGRQDLEHCGGWRRAPRKVDLALIEDVRRAGGAVYRTHGAGFMLVRHGHGHTRDADDEVFLPDADSVHVGWQPMLADVDCPDQPPVSGG